MNIIDNSGTGIAGLGRNEDRLMAHVAPGEMVVPQVISDGTRAAIQKEMQAAGLDPNEYEVGQGMSINPITGMAEFGFLSKLAKSVKKVVKKVAPILAVIPNPLQAFAAVYQKGSAALKLAKGEGGLGDIMTIMAGGNQTLTGEGGAFKNIASGASNNFGAAEGYLGSLKNIGKVGGAFKPLQYGQNIMKSKASDLKQGFGGALGGNAGKFNVNTGQMDYFTDATGNFTTRGFNPLKGISPMNNVPDQYVNAAGKTISIEAFEKLPAVDQAAYVPNASGGSFLDGKTPGQKLSSMFLPQSVEDALGTGPGGENVYSNKNSGGGINPQMAALALLYGKATKDAAERNKGGLTDIRNSLRPDLKAAPVFQGYDLGVRRAAVGGAINNYRFGGAAELDMRNGGPSNGPGTGTSDDIPAMLSDGEFVMTAAANNGAGGFDFLKTREGLELIPTGKPDRKKGVQVMNNLMDVFENYNETGRMA